MVTEEQKKVFADCLNDSFNENTKKNEETYKRTTQWLKNVYYKYIHSTLPEEHKTTLELRLKKRKITIEEFIDTKGSIDSLQELAKSKKSQKKAATQKENTKQEEIVNPEVVEKPVEEIQKVIETPVVEEIVETKKEKTIKEQLTEERDKLEVRIHELERCHSKKHRTLNHITDEEYEIKCNELKELTKQRLEINRKLDEIKVAEEKPKKEKEAVTKKMEELVIQGKKKDIEINKLKEEILKYKEERSYIKKKYEEEYDKKFEVYSTQLKEEYDNKLEKEVEKQISKANQKSENTLELQKAHILRMLLKNGTVSIDEIKMQLEKSKVSAANLDAAINELRIRIPGITRYYDLNEKEIVFSINNNALHKWNDLETNKTCPRISNSFEGPVRFIEHTDLHIDLKSTEDQLKRKFEPTFDYASEKNDLSTIINTGDIADTLNGITRGDWINHDKEAIEQAINFFKNFAKVLATVPRIKYYFLFGNHEKHIYLAGIDPLEIIYDYCDNFIPLGVNKGSFMIGNDKIGVFHEVQGAGKINQMAEKVPELAPDCIYSLIGHYHAGIHKPLNGCSFIRAGIDNPLLFRANLEDGKITLLTAKELILKNNKFECSQTETELYNSNYQYVKKSQ